METKIACSWCFVRKKSNVTNTPVSTWEHIYIRIYCTLFRNREIWDIQQIAVYTSLTYEKYRLMIWYNPCLARGFKQISSKPLSPHSPHSAPFAVTATISWRGRTVRKWREVCRFDGLAGMHMALRLCALRVVPSVASGGTCIAGGVPRYKGDGGLCTAIPCRSEFAVALKMKVLVALGRGDGGALPLSRGMEEQAEERVLCTAARSVSASHLRNRVTI